MYLPSAGADPGALGPAPTPGTEGPAPKARVPSSPGQKEGTLVSLEWLFNTIQHNMAINILKSCKSVFAYVKNRSSPFHIKSPIPWRPPLEEILDPRLKCVRIHTPMCFCMRVATSDRVVQTRFQNCKPVSAVRPDLIHV